MRFRSHQLTDGTVLKSYHDDANTQMVRMEEIGT